MAARRPQGARRALVVALVALLPARGVSDVPQRPSEVSGRQLCLELPDCSDADAVNLRSLDDANAGLEVGYDGRGLVGWNGRAADLTPEALALACPARTRSRIISRWNSANTPAICSNARPPETLGTI